VNISGEIGLKVELAVVGAGPAGMEAALAAATGGLQVALIERGARPGGQYFRQAYRGRDDSHGPNEASKLFSRLRQQNIHLITGATVWGIFPDNGGAGWQLRLHGTGTPDYLRANSLVLATGAYDYPLPFPGWTLPGVLTAGASQILVKSESVLPGKRILLAGSGPLLFAAAAALAKAAQRNDARLVGVLHAPFSFQQASCGLRLLWAQGRRLREGLAYARILASARIPVYWGWGIREVSGNDQVEQAVITRLDSSWKPVPGSERSLPVDTLVVGYGLLPNNHLGRMLGCKHTFDPPSGAWIPERDSTFQTSLPGVYIVGDAAEIHGAEAARLEGRLAGLAVACRSGYLPELQARRQIAALSQQVKNQHRFGRFLRQVFSPDLRNAKALLELAGERTIACRCEEITFAEVYQAIAAGAGSPAEIKMMTRAGMGNCQGRVCESNLTCALIAAGIVGENNMPGWQPLNIRPPLVPLSVSVLSLSELI
jgi:NADPH-dependent 2,4-dienoyl-CoA reductase/sulfur reductase-like enzyme